MSAEERPRRKRDPIVVLVPVRRAILAALSDGRPHHPDLVVKAVAEETGDCQFSPTNLNWHLDILRKYLRPKGQDIVKVKIGGRGRGHLQHVILMHNNDE